MKHILVYVSPDKHASLFDVVVAYDSGVDVVVPYHSVSVDEVKDIVYNLVYARSPNDLGNSAIFLGGHSIEAALKLADAFASLFNQLPSERLVSFGMDPDGAYTTASACVVKIKSALGRKLSGLSASVVAGTGPVGQITAVLLAEEGCDVILTSRNKARASSTCRFLKKSFGVDVTPAEAKDVTEMAAAVSESKIVVSAGPEGMLLVPKSIWSKSDALVLVDLNAVPPYGVEGLGVCDDGRRLAGGRFGFGAVAVGSLKMRCHRCVVRKLFEERGCFFDLGKIYKLAENL